MQTFEFILVMIGIFICLPLSIVWLNDKLVNRLPSKAKREENSRRFKERLLNPDIAGVEAFLGCSLPEEVKTLYANKEELLKADFELKIKEANGKEGVYYVAWYAPANVEDLCDYGSDDKRYYSFANDGCGNCYLIELQVNRSEVFFLDHETAEFTGLGVTLDEFISAPRK